MPHTPRIRRAVPDPNELYRTNQPIPVVASIRWATSNGWGPPQEVEAQILAWTLNAVEVAWKQAGATHIDWIDAHDVRPPPTKDET